MKRFLALLITLSLLLLAACSQTQPPVDSEPTTHSTTANEPSSTEPTTAPTNPSTEPSVPTEDTTEPSKPTESTTEPSTDEPSDPTTEPTTSPTEPATKPTQPSEPTTAPSNPGGNGSTDGTENPSQPTEPSKPDGTKSDTCTVKITEAVKDYTLKISQPSLSLEVGQIGNLTVNYTGTGTIVWKSSDESKATVSNGKVVAKAETSESVFITVTDGVKSSQCRVTITKKAENPVKVTLKLSHSNLNLKVGESKNLSVSYNGNKSLTWTSNTPSVATVDKNGKVTAKSAGTPAIITVTDGVNSAQCRVTVTAPAETFSINTKNDTIIFVGDTFQIDYTYSGDKSKLTWSSTDTGVLTVNSNGVVTGKSTGAATIEVSNGTTTLRVSINVSDAPKATSLEESNHNAPLYDGVVKYVGDYMTFKVIAKPDDCNPQVLVTSTNSSVVSVFYELNYYNITQVTLNFKSAGTAKVTMTSADGNVSESYNITVKADYACNPGSGLLTPEQFAYCVNKVVEAHDFTITNCSSYKWLTLSENELTWENAVWYGEQFVRAWWPIGSRRVNITYIGINENGKHLFYTYH